MAVMACPAAAPLDGACWAPAAGAAAAAPASPSPAPPRSPEPAGRRSPAAERCRLDCAALGGSGGGADIVAGPPDQWRRFNSKLLAGPPKASRLSNTSPA
ncbi:hypothetical protein Rsub_01869 [Raphidocelis subcapitata]|uniref:Uncharacterized protein n=1 Tax=Raphidocelis subcapitata TaxID=307507 RepID=A0A2V0NR86_9CHLO|nr:hypothetical protein Rsub_01869 [Raphidocelis subcapitata]|eukprot:GBF89152.1 hypothetical protein Rsub_01869 [Raphidocelis subcapitata]